MIERTGNSLRGPARDVLLSEATVKIGHGWGFGVHSAMDQTGAMVGPFLMALAVWKSHNFGPAFLKLAFPGGRADCALACSHGVSDRGTIRPATAQTTRSATLFWDVCIQRMCMRKIYRNFRRS